MLMIIERVITVCEKGPFQLQKVVDWCILKSEMITPR